MELKTVPADDRAFAFLTGKLDEYYFELVGDVHLRYAEANRPSNFACRMVVYEGEQAVACGCWKQVDGTTAEIKRLYVRPEYRRKGAARLLLKALEEDAARAGKTRAVLETARTTGDSHALYLSSGYRIVDYYGSPAGAENCLCFEKEI